MQPQRRVAVPGFASNAPAFQLPALSPAQSGSTSSLLDAVVGPGQTLSPLATHPTAHTATTTTTNAQTRPASRPSPLASYNSASASGSASAYASDASGESPFLLAGGSQEMGGTGAESTGSWSVLSDRDSRANSSALPAPSHTAGGVTKLGGAVMPHREREVVDPREQKRVEEMERVLEKRSAVSIKR